VFALCLHCKKCNYKLFLKKSAKVQNILGFLGTPLRDIIEGSYKNPKTFALLHCTLTHHDIIGEGEGEIVKLV